MSCHIVLLYVIVSYVKLYQITLHCITSFIMLVHRFILYYSVWCSAIWPCLNLLLYCNILAHSVFYSTLFYLQYDIILHCIILYGIIVCDIALHSIVVYANRWYCVISPGVIWSHLTCYASMMYDLMIWYYMIDMVWGTIKYGVVSGMTWYDMMLYRVAFSTVWSSGILFLESMKRASPGRTCRSYRVHVLEDGESRGLPCASWVRPTTTGAW